MLAARLVWEPVSEAAGTGDGWLSFAREDAGQVEPHPSFWSVNL